VLSTDHVCFGCGLTPSFIATPWPDTLCPSVCHHQPNQSPRSSAVLRLVGGRFRETGRTHLTVQKHRFFSLPRPGATRSNRVRGARSTGRGWETAPAGQVPVDDTTVGSVTGCLQARKFSNRTGGDSVTSQSFLSIQRPRTP